MKEINPKRITWKPGTSIYPVPAVMVTCGTKKSDYNIITVSWTGTICTNPPMCYISLRPERYSHKIISKEKEFVINLTTKELAFATDWCGVKSGEKLNKFSEMKLTPIKASKIKSPLIAESPINIECKVKKIIKLGSHDMFLSEVVAINVNPRFLNSKTNSFNLEAAEPIAYSHGKYYSLGKRLGKFGFSVEKKKTKNKRKLKNKNDKLK